MQDFLANNWLSIVSILIGVVVAYFFYRLQKRDSASASVERKKHAHFELLDVIESYLINKQELTKNVIINLISAAERYHSVDLRLGCTPISLLQDVALRLQRSRHLDIPQKSEYSVSIDRLIQDETRNNRPATWESMTVDTLAVIEQVIALVPTDHQLDVREKLGTLAAMGALTKKHGDVIDKIDSTGAKLSALSALTAGLAAALVTSSVGTKLLSEMNESTDPLVGKLVPIVVVALGVMVLMSIALILARIRKRNSEKHES
ncbi:hypothetical protein [Pseudomonas syringae]|uniref:hypothetical protein n=1 Tax=Pseudomonas syringae TaxID=317 RepID=UPI003204C2D3